jgi:hypothetical protein
MKYDGTTFWQIYKVSSTGITETSSSLPEFFRFTIKPFISLSGKVNINYGVTRKMRISLYIYDITGSVVKELVKNEVEPGSYCITWNGTDAYGRRAPEGIYFCRLNGDNFSATKKMVLLK